MYACCLYVCLYVYGGIGGGRNMGRGNKSSLGVQIFFNSNKSEFHTRVLTHRHI